MNKMDKPVYSMSEVGGCPRAIAAKRLGYNSIPRSPGDEESLDYYSSMEAVAAQQITRFGFSVYGGDYCVKCDRYGIHVEIDTPILTLVGHLDRRVIYNDSALIPCEIKCLGKNTYGQWAKERFGVYPEYAGQEACYLHAEGKPGIYWVMSRDSGKSLKYIINDKYNEFNFPDFEKLTLPVTFEEVLEKIEGIEILAQYNELPPVEGCENSFWCGYKFLCPQYVDKGKVLDLPEVLEAASTYLEGDELVKTGDGMKKRATESLVGHAKATEGHKFRAGGLSVTYTGEKRRKYLDEAELKKMVESEIIEKATKFGRPYDGFSIRKVKPKE